VVAKAALSCASVMDGSVRSWDDAGHVALVALNFGGEGQETVLDFPRSGKWREVVTARVDQMDEEPFALLLPPWQGWLFLPEA